VLIVIIRNILFFLAPHSRRYFRFFCPIIGSGVPLASTTAIPQGTSFSDSRHSFIKTRQIYLLNKERLSPAQSRISKVRTLCEKKLSLYFSIAKCMQYRLKQYVEAAKTAETLKVILKERGLSTLVGKDRRAVDTGRAPTPWV
jgi:hypothetical protein